MQNNFTDIIETIILFLLFILVASAIAFTVTAIGIEFMKLIHGA